MEDRDSVSHSHTFRGHTYIVTVQELEGHKVMVEVEDRLTADQWRATFDSQYIENLTTKTGNFKQFNVFANMLQSAVAQNSDSVSLDLLTYADLESLRKQKAGTPKSSIPSSRHTSLSTKRYLILLYTVEFDKIHYPLPLTYMGPPNPTTLQETVRELRDEIILLKKQNRGHSKTGEVVKLQKELKLLQQEKDDQETSFVELSQALNHTNEGRAVKEIRLLKGVIKNLENDLLHEKTRNQRSATKRHKEYQELLAEVEELRASERNHRVRVKSLTNELSLLKRQNSQTRRPNTSRERSYNHTSSFTYSRDRSSSRDRLPPMNRSSSRDRIPPINRSSSRDRLPPISRSSSRDRLVTRSNSRDRPVSAPNVRSSRERSSYEWKPSFRRSRTPSPGNKPRFDPTAYIKERERIRDEAVLTRQRYTHRPYGSAERKNKLTPRNSSNERKNISNRSRLSSAGSRGYSSDDAYSDSSYTGLGINKRKNQAKTRLRTTNSYLTSPNISHTTRNHSGDGRDPNVTSTPVLKHKNKQPLTNKKTSNKENGSENEFYDRSVEISEIDARLERLQKMMKTSLQCTT